MQLWINLLIGKVSRVIPWVIGKLEPIGIAAAFSLEKHVLHIIKIEQFNSHNTFTSSSVILYCILSQG